MERRPCRRIRVADGELEQSLVNGHLRARRAVDDLDGGRGIDDAEPDPPEGAAGTFRLWITNGAVTKYELKLTANTAPGGRGGSYSETRAIELSGVGSTRVEVPEAAKRRLGG